MVIWKSLYYDARSEKHQIRSMFVVWELKRNVPVVRFKFRCNILISCKIIKEMPGSVASETHCRSCTSKNMIKPSTTFSVFQNHFNISICFLYSLTCFSCQASLPRSCRSWPQHEWQPHQHPPPSSWGSYWLLFQYTSQVSLQATVSRWTCYLFSSYLSFSSNYHTQICSQVIKIRLQKDQNNISTNTDIHMEKRDFTCTVKPA